MKQQQTNDFSSRTQSGLTRNENGGGTNSQTYSSRSNDAYLDEGAAYYYDQNNNPDDYKKVKKRVQNRESAVRTRMKKKAFYESVEIEL